MNSIEQYQNQYWLSHYQSRLAVATNESEKAYLARAVAHEQDRLEKIGVSSKYILAKQY